MKTWYFCTTLQNIYKQSKVDPADIDLLGIKFDHNYYTDREIYYVMAQHGFHTFFNYIDDILAFHLKFKLLLRSKGPPSIARSGH